MAYVRGSSYWRDAGGIEEIREQHSKAFRRINPRDLATALKEGGYVHLKCESLRPLRFVLLTSPGAISLNAGAVPWNAPDGSESMDRKTVPQALTARGAIVDGCKAMWLTSRNHMDHTFVGITSLRDGRFHMFPGFMRDKPGDSNRNRFQKFFSLSATKAARRVPATKQFEYNRREQSHPSPNVRAYDAGPRKEMEVKTIYPNGAIILPYQPAVLVDGSFHKEACRRAGVTENEAIGWSIDGHRPKESRYLIRFVSGRNLGKFDARRIDDPNKEARDLPKAWANWIVLVLQRDLSIQVQPLQRTRGGRTSKFTWATDTT